MSKRRYEKLHTVSIAVRRIVALVLVFCFLIPSRAYALDTAISYGSQLLGGDKKEEEAVPKSDYADQYASEADKLKQRLSADTGQGKKKLRLSQCKTLAVATSEKIEAVDMKIDAKTAKMQSSVRALRERERSMGTVRWSPIFNIKLPTKPNEAEAFEFQFKPTQLQNEITLLKHKIKEIELDSNEKVSNTYIKIITANDEVERLSARYKKLQATVAKLEVKVKDGTAAVEQGVTETDAEGNEVQVSPRVLKDRVKAAQDKLKNAEDRLDNCQVALSNAKTDFETAKKKLSDQISFDCTQNFNFEDAFITANMDRDAIEYLYSYALDDDASVYEAQMNNDEALLTLRINYDLCKKHYPDNIATIESYVQQALDGIKIPKKSFKKDYDKFLKDIDAPWQGNYKIWFIKIPKEWLKGDIDGIRYVEDDPYVLYTATLEYETARKELENAKYELYNNIYESYSNYASTRKAYLAANKAYIKAEKLLGIDEVRYLLGELTADEFETEESEYNSLKDDAADALSEFSETLYSFDRTTCGGVSKFFEGAAQADMEAISLTPIIRTGCIYTIRPIIDTQEFLLSIDVPNDFYATTGITITAFELYCDNVQIGDRTQVGSSLRHLMLSTKDLGECIIRVYNGETFVSDCVIEPTVFSGPLNIVVGYEDGAGGHVLGKYTTSDEVATDMMVLDLNLDQEKVRAEYENGNDAAYYKLCLNNGKYILSDRLVPVDQTFTYLSILKNDLASTYLELYDKDMGLIGKAFFDTQTKEIYNEISEEAAAKLAEQKKEEAARRAEQEEEEKRLAEEKEKRDKAKELLQSLGMPTDEKTISYALEHYNELSYSLELLMASASLAKEHEKDVEKYNAMLNDPKTKPEDLKAMADRVRITEQMPGIYDQTLGDGLKYNVAELEKYTEQYLKQLTAEYISEYNVLHDDSATEARKESARTRMREIKTEVEDKYKSDAIKVAEQAIIPIEETLTKLYSVKRDKMFTQEQLDYYKAQCEICVSAVKQLKDAGYGESYKDRYHKALLYALKFCGAEAKVIKDDSTVSVTTLEDSYVAKAKAVNDYAVYINKTLSKSKAVDESAVTDNVDLADDAWAKVEEIETVRQDNITKANKELTDNYKKLAPMSDVVKKLMGSGTYDTFITDAYNKAMSAVDEVDKYHGTPAYTKEQIKKQYKECAKDLVNSLNEKLKTAYEKMEDKDDLRKKLAKAESKYNTALRKYQETGGGTDTEADYREAKLEFEKLEKEFNNHVAYMEKLAAECEGYIEQITVAGGTPTYTKTQVSDMLEKIKKRNVNEEKTTTN